jgi:hypothetical protein
VNVEDLDATWTLGSRRSHRRSERPYADDDLPRSLKSASARSRCVGGFDSCAALLDETGMVERCAAELGRL